MDSVLHLRMMNTTDASTIALLNRLSLEINRFITLFVVLFGTVGNTLNIFVLAQRKLRSNPSVIYFLNSATAGLIILLVGLPTRIIVGWTSIDPTNTNSFLCKGRIFLLYGCRTIFVWLIVLASFDRWLVTSSQWFIHRCQFNSSRTAYRAVLITSILSFLLWFESLFCYDTDITDAPLRCYGKTHACRIFNDVTYAMTTVIIPSMLMLFFGQRMIENIAKARQPVTATIVPITLIDATNQRRQASQRREQASLTRMLLVQVILLTFFSLPQAIHQLYLTFTLHVVKTPLHLSIENFIVNFNFSLTYVGNGIPFYIYTLTGTTFRQTLIHLLRECLQRIHAFFLIFSKVVLRVRRNRPNHRG
jgi:hypothetical protein